MLPLNRQRAGDNRWNCYAIRSRFKGHSRVWGCSFSLETLERSQSPFRDTFRGHVEVRLETVLSLVRSMAAIPWNELTLFTPVESGWDSNPLSRKARERSEKRSFEVLRFLGNEGLNCTGVGGLMVGMPLGFLSSRTPRCLVLSARKGP